MMYWEYYRWILLRCSCCSSGGGRWGAAGGGGWGGIIDGHIGTLYT